MTEVLVAAITGLSVVLQAMILKRQQRVERQQKDDDDRMQLILECQEACLLGVRELGANGRTKDALRKLEDYKNRKAAS